MLPTPPERHDAPPVPRHVQLTPVRVAGNTSMTVAPTTSFGPPFVATIVYDTGSPQVTPVRLSLRVSARSAYVMPLVTVV
jgi:hypothetical protein